MDTLELTKTKKVKKPVDREKTLREAKSLIEQATICMLEACSPLETLVKKDITDPLLTARNNLLVLIHTTCD